jgi:Dolichyl-phosphate-mannose-protein mannosyltransferase
LPNRYVAGPLAGLSNFTDFMNASRSLYTKGYFLLILLLGLLVFRDYGVTWDEPVDRMNGMVNLKYITSLIAPSWAEQQVAFANTPDFATYLENDHGPIFHLPLAVFDQQWGGSDARPYYLVRHLCIFLVVVLGAWALYRLAWLRSGSWKWGLVASSLLFLSPRFFAESFNNGKDIVFMAFFTLAIYTLVRLLQRPTWSGAVLHGLLTALATDVRIMGCLLFFITFGMVALEAILAPANPQARRKLLKCAGMYYVAAFVFTIIGWPYLWEAPAGNFLLAFANMRQFRWNGEVIYLGSVMRAMELPWHYAPVWIIATTPVAYVVAFFVGFAVSAGSLLRRWGAHLRTFEGRLDLLFLGWAVGPLLMVIVFDSIIYDGWRHLYFIYPAILLVAVRGAVWVWRQGYQSATGRRVALVLALLAAAEGVFTVARMVEAHPNQQVYFSFLPAAKAEELFERDYWGSSYRQGLEWLLTHDPAPVIPVYAAEPELLENALSILKPDERARFQVLSTKSERYYLTNYRFHPQPYSVEEVGWEVHAVRSNGVKILSVFSQK